MKVESFLPFINQSFIWSFSVLILTGCTVHGPVPSQRLKSLTWKNFFGTFANLQQCPLTLLLYLYTIGVVPHLLWATADHRFHFSSRLDETPHCGKISELCLLQLETYLWHALCCNVNETCFKLLPPQEADIYSYFNKRLGIWMSMANPT